MELSIGERIVNLRKKAGLTQAQLAEKLNISDKAVSKWESGKGDPSLEMIVLLAEVFDCSLGFLIKGHDKCEVLDENEFADKCFDLLKNEIGSSAYEKFVKKYKFVGFQDRNFCFEMTDKKLVDANFEECKDDDVFDVLIDYAVNLNKNYNGYSLKLVDNFQSNIPIITNYVEEVFEKLIERVKIKVSALTFDVWFSAMKPLEIKVRGEDVYALVVLVPSNTTKEFIQKNYYKLMLNEIKKIDNKIKVVEFRTEEVLKQINFRKAVKAVIECQGASVSMIQRKLSLGYSRAAQIIDQMEDMGLISAPNDRKLRDVFVDKKQFEEMFKIKYDDVEI